MLCLALLALLLPLSCMAADYPSTVQADEPLAYWRLEETAGTSVADSSGHGRVGKYTALADPKLTPLLGQPSASAALGHAADLATGALGVFETSGEGLTRSRDFAIEMWLKPTRSGYAIGEGKYFQTLVSTGGDGGKTGWDLSLAGSPEQGWTPRLASAGQGDVSGKAGSLPHGVWSHLVVSVDSAGQVGFFVNGALSHAAGPLPAITPSTAVFRVGGPATPTWTGNFAFFGCLDEVAVYDHSLAAARVQAHFAAAGYTPAAVGPRPVAAAGRDPYTTETTGHVLVWLPPAFAGRHVTADLLLGERALAKGLALIFGPPAFPLGELPAGESVLTCRLSANGAEVARLSVPVRKLPSQPNEVRLDRQTGGVIVDGLPTIPFGFYCNADPGGLPDDEVVNGFNTIAPYWNEARQRTPEDLAKTKRVMDRCAALGMRVHYHLNSLGVQPASEAKWAALRAEVEAFRNHPALLAWYIADEPDSGVPWAVLEETRRFIRELDPYHPVTLVLMGADRAPDYAGGADVLMGDPYPIPGGAVTEPGEWMARARELTHGLVPLWVVPQAFGGGEGTEREPTAAEERMLTYLPLLHGARGVQFFVRRAPLGNPKSPVAWSECRTLAMEIAALTPALLSPELAPAVALEPATVQGKAYMDRGLLTLVLANTQNAPTTFTARLEGVNYGGPAALPFEHRQVAVREGVVSEPIDAFGTRVYQFPVGKLPDEDLAVHARNLVLNPSWEDNPNVGTPEGCYLSVGADRGSSAMIDARLARHGRHCLRLVTAAAGGGMTLSAFPIKLAAGQSVAVSVWAKGLTAGRFHLELPGVGARDFDVTTQWQEYRFIGRVAEPRPRVNVALSLTSAGTAWFDMLQVTPEG